MSSNYCSVILWERISAKIDKKLLCIFTDIMSLTGLTQWCSLLHVKRGIFFKNVNISKAMDVIDENLFEDVNLDGMCKEDIF